MYRSHLIYIICAAAALSWGACSHAPGHRHDDSVSTESKDGHHHEDHDADDHDHDHEGHNHEAEDHDVHSHEHSGTDTDEIRLSPEMAKRFGVQSEIIEPGTFSESVKATGRLLATGSSIATVTAPTSGILSYPRTVTPGAEVGRGAVIASVDAGAVTGGDANAGARAALEAAKREYDRLKPLYEERLVTASEFNAARAAYESARAAYSTRGASGKAVSPIAGVILSLDAAEGQYVEPGTPVATVASDRELTLRIDLPRKYASRTSTFGDVRLALPDGSTALVSELGGKRTGAAAAGNASSAYIPLFFTIPNRNKLLIPGEAMEVWLLGAERPEVLRVPLSALSEQMGQYFVYEQLDDECYRKLPVIPGESDGRNVEIRSGLTSGQRIVTQGTTTVRLSENSKAIPEGHSHHH